MHRATDNDYFYLLIWWEYWKNAQLNFLKLKVASSNSLFLCLLIINIVLTPNCVAHSQILWSFYRFIVLLCKYVFSYYFICISMFRFVYLYKGPSKDGHCNLAWAINGVVCGTDACHIFLSININITLHWYL